MEKVPREMHRGRGTGVWSFHASSGGATLQDPDMFTNLGNSSPIVTYLSGNKPHPKAILETHSKSLH